MGNIQGLEGVGHVSGRAVARFGARPTLWASFAVAGIGLPLMLTASLAAMLAGLVLVGVGTFAAPTTGFASRAAAPTAALLAGRLKMMAPRATV